LTIESGGAGEVSIVNRHSSFVNPIHPSLSTIWPAAAVAEREIFEMFGIPFAGNALEPLLLDEAFVGHPLRKDFVVPAQPTYIERLLEQRHTEGLIEALSEAVGAAPAQPSWMLRQAEASTSAEEGRAGATPTVATGSEVIDD
jgi:hypothetical protein